MKDYNRPNQEAIVLDTKSSPINDSLFRRFITLTATKVFGPFRRNGRAMLLTDGICVKFSRSTRLSEAVTMEFVRQNTDIPVPRVICSFVHRAMTYIVMERIHGKPLAAVWPSLSDFTRNKTLTQLQSLIASMRQVKRPNDFEGVANVAGGCLFDPRLPRTDNGFGPFRTIQDFHKFLRNDLTRLPDLDPEIDQMIELHDGPWPAPVFTHGDLSSLNVLVDGDEIVGIVDWEFSGWYPHYWEYTTANQVNAFNLFWKDQIQKFLEPMPKELAMDQTRNIYFGDVG